LDSDIIREIVQKRRATGRSSHRPKVLSLTWQEERGPIRLNKYIANSGICSRREADDLIVAGAITVNGVVVTELGTKVMPIDEVRYEDKVLQREKPVYILLNKPKGYITTTDDERGRDNVMMLIEGACTERVYPVGRLDRETTGLLLFTNDGEMTKKLTHPRHGFKKIYQVELDRDLSLTDFETLSNGIELSDGMMKPDEVAFVDGQKNVLGIVLHSGRNRIVRRLFEYLDYEIEKLDRVYYAGLTKKDLPRGSWRFLRQEEINILKMSL
jgi:23S rRNA pseudouridine2605 synthase